MGLQRLVGRPDAPAGRPPRRPRCHPRARRPPRCRARHWRRQAAPCPPRAGTARAAPPRSAPGARAPPHTGAAAPAPPRGTPRGRPALRAGGRRARSERAARPVHGLAAAMHREAAARAARTFVSCREPLRRRRSAARGQRARHKPPGSRPLRGQGRAVGAGAARAPSVSSCSSSDRSASAAPARSARASHPAYAATVIAHV